MVWLTAVLLFIACGMAFIVHVGLPLPSSKLAGVFLLGISAINVPFSTDIGRRTYIQMCGKAIVGWIWLRLGQKGSQLLFLGIALIVGIAGCVLLIFGSR
jgi:hypothetical protein